VTVPEIPEVALAEFLADLGNSTLDLTTAMARCTKAMGLQHSVAYLADLQQRQLTPLNDLVRTLPIDDSLAGWTYRTQSLRVEKSDFGGRRPGCRLWTGRNASASSLYGPRPSTRCTRWPWNQVIEC
jgi:hypothetical protein